MKNRVPTLNDFVNNTQINENQLNETTYVLDDPDDLGYESSFMSKIGSFKIGMPVVVNSVTGMMGEEKCNLTFFMSDGKDFEFDSMSQSGPPESYYKQSGRTKPEWARIYHKGNVVELNAKYFFEIVLPNYGDFAPMAVIALLFYDDQRYKKINIKKLAPGFSK